MEMNNCNCGQCQPKKKCKNPCSCAEPVFSIEAMPDDPTILRFNVNGKSVWYDFEPVVKSGETCTTLTVDITNRTLNYNGECGENTIAAKELGAILHLADIGDVNANSIEDNGILNYRKDTDCGEGCEGDDSGWVSSSPLEIAKTSMDYILGADAEGKMVSLMPPTDTTSFSYLAWGAQNKANWVKPTIVSTPPVKNGYRTRLWLDENTGEIVATREEVS